MIPLKLENLVNEHYGGSITLFVEKTQEYALDLRKMQRTVYEQQEQLQRLPTGLPHKHSLRKYWSQEQVEEFERISDALLEDNEYLFLMVVKDSYVLRVKNDLYAVPARANLSAAGSAVSTGFTMRMVGSLLPPVLRNGLTVLGVVYGGVHGVIKNKVKNPFEKLGETFLKKVKDISLDSP